MADAPAAAVAVLPGCENATAELVGRERKTHGTPSMMTEKRLVRVTRLQWRKRSTGVGSFYRFLQIPVPGPVAAGPVGGRPGVFAQRGRVAAD
jgi:hypothetical protein